MSTRAGGKRMKIVIAIVVILIVLLCVVSLGGAHFVMNGKRPTLQEAWEWQSARYDTSFYERLQKTDYLVTGHDGYQLHVQLLQNPSPTTRDATDPPATFTTAWGRRRLGGWGIGFGAGAFEQARRAPIS